MAQDPEYLSVPVPAGYRSREVGMPLPEGAAHEAGLHVHTHS